MHGDGREQGVARLREQRLRDAQRAIENRKTHRAGEQRRNRRLASLIERVRAPFESIGHGRIDEFADEEQHESQQHAPFEIGAALGPNIGPKMRERREKTGVLEVGVDYFRRAAAIAGGAASHSEHCAIRSRGSLNVGRDFAVI